MTDFAASACTALMIAGTAVGGLLGGWLGDMVGTKHPNHGRVLLVQVRHIEWMMIMMDDGNKTGQDDGYKCLLL